VETWKNHHSTVAADLSANGKFVTSTKFFKTTGHLYKFYKKVVQQAMEVLKKLKSAQHQIIKLFQNSF
jgi:hypothetical protein